MTFDQFKILAKGLRAVYTSPNFLPDADSIKIWYQLLKDISYEVLNAAIMKWCTTQKFPPTIADLREACSGLLAEPDEDDWSKGWELTMAAVQRFGSYQGSLALASLPDVVRQTAERIGWQNICAANLEDVNVSRAQYRDIYNAVASRKRKETMIPESLRIKISEICQIGDQAALPEKGA